MLKPAKLEFREADVIRPKGIVCLHALETNKTGTGARSKESKDFEGGGECPMPRNR